MTMRKTSLANGVLGIASLLLLLVLAFSTTTTAEAKSEEQSGPCNCQALICVGPTCHSTTCGWYQCNYSEEGCTDGIGGGCCQAICP